jgi:hypothetical protein
MAIVNDVLENPGHDGIVRVGEIVHECVQSPPPLSLSFLSAVFLHAPAKFIP